jgi:hypothetical protein
MNARDATTNGSLDPKSIQQSVRSANPLTGTDPRRRRPRRIREILSKRVKVHCVRCGTDFEVDCISEGPLTQEQKDYLFKFCPFCHPGIVNAIRLTLEKEFEFFRKHVRPYVQPYRERPEKD